MGGNKSCVSDILRNREHQNRKKGNFSGTMEHKGNFVGNTDVNVIEKMFEKYLEMSHTVDNSCACHCRDRVSCPQPAVMPNKDSSLRWTVPTGPESVCLSKSWMNC